MSSPMEAMLAMRMNQPQPSGPNQQLAQQAAPSAPQNAPGAPQMPGMGDDSGPPVTAPQGALQGLGDASVGSGNVAALMQYLPILQKMYPKLKLADLKNGVAELAGPTQEQFLGAAHAKHHGAKQHHVRNRHGRGQRLHVSF